ncbi:intercellular adhesion molecule 1-like [Pyrgilauda ruficollis]|uniref:intercellular adhesion molecule 1-like n=1 Tax=Pyrgilauda ruficollis TaxID=221976 RepID=UPI001B87527B|nr:intercellular adhesion molecule 1-like [Pyrgilauda ruficollis]
MGRGRLWGSQKTATINRGGSPKSAATLILFGGGHTTLGTTRIGKEGPPKTPPKTPEALWCWEGHTGTPRKIRVTFRTGGAGDTRGHPRTSAVGGGVSVQVTGAPPAGTGGTARGGGLAGVARGTFTVVAWPRVAVVAFGGSVTVNCSRSACPGDNATLGLETPLAATPGAGGLRWQSFRLQNVSRWNPGPVTCSGRCGDTEANASAGVLVYQLPERVELEPVPPVAVGDSRNLTCHVLEVAPLRNLTVTLRRGAETLRTESFGDAEGSASVAVSHLLTATRGDHGQDVTCHAELSLRPHGPLFARAAVPVTLSVFGERRRCVLLPVRGDLAVALPVTGALSLLWGRVPVPVSPCTRGVPAALPEPPQLQAPAILEAGTAAAASCRIAGAFPAGDIRVTAALGREPLNVSVAVAGDTVTASTELSPRSPGPRELSCTAAVATAARTARRQLHVYRFPAPALELSPAPAAAGSEVTVTCHAGATEPPAARLQLRDADGGVLAEGPQPRLQLRLLARRDDDGREFRCRASLAVGDSVVTKDAEARLEVLYLPEIPASGCPGNRTWVRGAREALSCRATGNPAPTVVCGRDGVAVATGEPEPVTRARAGTYLCNATNALGTRSRRVTVRVECEWHRGAWLVALAALGALGAVTALGLAAAGGFYLKSTACKKGEYNVRDAEGSSEAACLHRHREARGEAFGIQLSPP